MYHARFFASKSFACQALSSLRQVATFLNLSTNGSKIDMTSSLYWLISISRASYLCKASQVSNANPPPMREDIENDIIYLTENCDPIPGVTSAFHTTREVEDGSLSTDTH